MPAPVLELQPDVAQTVRRYLLGLTAELELEELTELGGRVYTDHLPARPILPALRVADVSTSSSSPGWSRALVQVDVFHSAGRLPDARRLAGVVRAALEAAAGVVLEGAVLAFDPQVGATAQPFGDGTDPTVPGTDANNPATRYVVQSGIVVRPS